MALSLQKDEFNSMIFGLIMGNLEENGNGEYSSLQEAVESAKHLGFEHLAIRIDTNNKPLVYEAENHDFRLMDTLVTYGFALNRDIPVVLQHEFEIASCKKDDMPILETIAKNSFTFDRYHSDPSLSQEAADQYYAKWMHNSFYQSGFTDHIIVALLHGKPIGFTTYKVGDERNPVRLVLSAVTQAARGKGAYTSMLYEGILWAKKQKDAACREFFIGTQINNTVQKIWIKFGFSIRSSQYILHRTLKRNAPV